MPVTVVLAFLFKAGDRGGKPNGPTAVPATATALPGVAVPAPPAPNPATQQACIKVFQKLPVQLGTLPPRKTETDSSFVAAWGDPAIVIRCGVSRPAVFGTPTAAQLLDVSGIIWQPDLQKTQTVYTAVDRSVYIDVTVPANQDQPLPDLAPAIAALPQKCTATDSVGNTTNKKLPICGG
ncbi:MAG: hypothetical protein QOE89_320 [Pseudonocardiales bacterium]|nr:hypothetical protein [Pseudonocardiales bacterium]